MNIELVCFKCEIKFCLDRRYFRARQKKEHKHSFCSQRCLHEYQSELFRKERETAVRKFQNPDGVRTCPRCGPKPISQFGKRTSQGGFQSFCKPCLYLAQQRRWNQLKIKAIELLGGKCSRCELVDHPVVYDFHHRDPNKKEFDWGRLRRKKWTSIEKELSKCDLLCSPCHRKHHTNLSMWPDRQESNLHGPVTLSSA